MNTLIFFKKNRGFTLIELLIVLFLLSLVMMSIYALFRTHQRAAYTQDEVVELQQNLRIGMESMTRDIRMAGFLSNQLPVSVIQHNIGPVLSTVTVTSSDSITITTASATMKIARINPQPPIGATTFIIDDPSSVNTFQGNENVWIIRPGNRIFPDNNANPTSPANSYLISGMSHTVPSITLGTPPGGIFVAGDLIVDSDGGPYPNTIQYCLGSAIAALSPICPSPNCPAGQLCLMRIVNGPSPNGTANLIAQNMAGLSFSALFDDGLECSNLNACSDPNGNYNTIRAVRVKLTGQTVQTQALSNNTPKQREIDTVIYIRDRLGE